MTVVIARALGLLCLTVIVAVTLWPTAWGELPDRLVIPGAAKVTLFLFSMALLFATSRDERLARRLAMASVAFAGLVLLSWLVTIAVGTPSVLAKIGSQSLLGKVLALRPTALMALGIATLGGSLWWRSVASENFDGSALLGTAATCIFFLICVGHLYGASSLTVGSDPAVSAASGLAAAMLFALSLASLALHPAGPLAAYEGDGPGPMAKRRLLPAAVLTPIGSGFVLLYAIKGQYLSPTLAVALTVFANVLVMLLLINAAGNKVSRVVWDRQKRMEAREAHVRKQGQRDPMTQLLNRRGWDAEVTAGEKQCASEGTDACVLVMDLDGLKQVNDNEGHKAGDVFIQRAAAALRKAARRGDALARLGGDEFAYLSVGCDESAARAVVGRFEDALRAGRVNASVGYSMRGDGTLDQAFVEADAAMYEQKRARKQRRA